MQIDPQKLQACRNCLSRFRTPNKSARRRNESSDQNQLLVNCLPPFFTDARVKILQSKALRRLASKTHVFSHKTNVHIRSRLTHSLEVAQVASTICQILGLNSELAFAIGLGHDIGHTPLGHPGESFIAQITGKPFRHEKMNVIIAQHIERKGQGLFLTHQVLQGFLHHSLGKDTGYVEPSLLPEINTVRLADTIANTFGNFNDIFERIGFKLTSYPKLQKLVQQCGHNQRTRINFFTYHVCLESAEQGSLSFSISEASHLLNAIKQEMYDIYPLTNLANTRQILEIVHDYLQRNVKEIDPALLLALMTDNDIFLIFEASKRKGKKISPEYLKQCSIHELIPFLRRKQIDFTNPDLDW